MTTAYMMGEKNKVASSTATLMLLEIVMPATPPPDPTYTTVRIVQNEENITWRGETWQALPVEIDEINSSSKGEVPRVDIRIGNQTVKCGTISSCTTLISKPMDTRLSRLRSMLSIRGTSRTPLQKPIFTLN